LFADVAHADPAELDRCVLSLTRALGSGERAARGAAYRALHALFQALPRASESSPRPSRELQLTTPFALGELHGLFSLELLQRRRSFLVADGVEGLQDRVMEWIGDAIALAVAAPNEEREVTAWASSVLEPLAKAKYSAVAPTLAARVCADAATAVQEAARASGVALAARTSADHAALVRARVLLTVALSEDNLDIHRHANFGADWPVVGLVVALLALDPDTAGELFEVKTLVKVAVTLCQRRRTTSKSWDRGSACLIRHIVRAAIALVAQAGSGSASEPVLASLYAQSVAGRAAASLLSGARMEDLFHAAPDLVAPLTLVALIAGGSYQPLLSLAKTAQKYAESKKHKRTPCFAVAALTKAVSTPCGAGLASLSLLETDDVAPADVGAIDAKAFASFTSRAVRDKAAAATMALIQEYPLLLSFPDGPVLIQPVLESGDGISIGNALCQCLRQTHGRQSEFTATTQLLMHLAEGVDTPDNTPVRAAAADVASTVILSVGSSLQLETKDSEGKKTRVWHPELLALLDRVASVPAVSKRLRQNALCAYVRDMS